MSAPETMPFANAHLAWKILKNNLPPETKLRWQNVVATLELFFTHEDTARIQQASPDLLVALEGLLSGIERGQLTTAEIAARAAIAAVRGGA